MFFKEEKKKTTQRKSCGALQVEGDDFVTVGKRAEQSPLDL